MPMISCLSSIRNNLNKGGDYGLVPYREPGNTIPKTIHQTYHLKNLPVEIQENINKLKSMNPGWEHKLYDDADIDKYIAQNMPELYKFYQMINPVYGAARADFFRYVLIYNEGGVYLDIKSSANKPLDEIIKNDTYLLSHWRNDVGDPFYSAGITPDIPNPLGEFQQWHIIAVKGHPFLKAVLENVCNNLRTYNPFFNHTGRWGVMSVTGPVAYSNAILPILKDHQHRLERSNDDLNLVYSIYSDTIEVKHHNLYKHHYSSVNESITKQAYLNQFFFKLWQPVKEYFILVFRNLKKH